MDYSSDIKAEEAPEEAQTIKTDISQVLVAEIKTEPSELSIHDNCDNSDSMNSMEYGEDAKDSTIKLEEEAHTIKTDISQVLVAEIKNEPELSIHDNCDDSDSMEFKEEAYYQNVYEIKMEIEDNESSGREFLTDSESEYQTDAEEEEEEEEETDTEEEKTDAEEEEADAEEEENHQSNLHSQNDLRDLLHVCPICGDEFENENREEWTSHLTAEHELDKVDKLNYTTIIPGSDSKSNDRHLKCNICEKVFTTADIRVMKKHAYSHMPFQISKCKICGTGYNGYKRTPCNCDDKNKDFLMMRNCTLLCSKCDAPFEDGKQLKIHLGTEHNIRLPEDLNFKSVGKIDNYSKKYECTKCQLHITLRGQSFDAMLRHAFAHDKHRMYQCNHCKKTFTKVFNFKKHEAVCQTAFLKNKALRLDKNIKRLCPACGWRFTSQKSFERHIKNVHSLTSMESLSVAKVEDELKKRPIHKCMVCDHVFEVKSMTVYKNHAFQHMPYKMFNCGICDQGFDTQLDVNKHLKAEHNVDIDKSTCRANIDIIYVCPVCNVEMKSHDAQMHHINKEHQLNTSLKGLSMKEVVIYDQKGVEVKKVFECLECGAQLGSTSQRSARMEHRMLHLPYKPYKCMRCEKSLSHISYFGKHQGKCNKLKPKLKKKRTKCQANLNMLFSCPVCNVELASQDAQMQHMNTEHQINTTLKGLSMKEIVIYDQKGAEDKKVYECLECGAQLSNNSYPIQRLQHRISHLPYKPYKCKRCGISLSRVFAIRKHIIKCKKLISDPMDKFNEFIKYACPECNMSLPTMSDWEFHIQQNHKFFDELNLIPTGLPGNRSHKCTDCGTHLGGTLSRQKSHKLRHMPFSSFVCRLCCHRSNSFDPLVDHLRRIHFKPGTFKCPICSLVLETSYQCAKHCRTDHTPDQYPPQFCTSCKMLYSSRKKWDLHLKMHDSNAEINKQQQRLNSECLICHEKFGGRSKLEEHIKSEHWNSDDGDVLDAELDQRTCKYCHRKFKTTECIPPHVKKFHLNQIMKNL